MQIPEVVTVDLYGRVSTIEQAEEGYSLQEQERMLRAFAEAHGWRVNACYIDPGFSGAKLDRPGIQAVISDCKAHKVQKVVTYKLDRLSRSQKDTLYLIEDVFIPNGVDYVSMVESLDTGTPFGVAMIGLLSVFAQLERETIKERMALGKAASIREGNWRGGDSVPIGYRYRPGVGSDSGTIVPDDLEAQAVRRMFELFLQGNSYRGILSRIREEYPMPERGQHNKGSWVASILQNRIYIGQMKYKGEWYPGNFEPIVDEGVFWAVQSRMVEYQETLDGHRRVPRQRGHLLTGFIWCGCCGGRMNHKQVHHVSKKTGERATYNSYVCWNKSQGAQLCPDSSQWKASELEELVLAQIEALRLEDLQPASSGAQTEIRALEKKLAGISRQQERLVELFTLDGISAEAIQKQSRNLSAERDRVLAHIEVLRTKDNNEALKQRLAAVERSVHIRDMTDDEKRDIMRLLIEKITVYPDRQVVINWKV